jgi:GNAT superfamily N-acetyltransferase
MSKPKVSWTSDISKVDVVSTQTVPDAVYTFATIYYQAFAPKLKHLELFPQSATQAVTILSESLNLHQGLCVINEGEILAVAGLDYGGQRFVTFRWTSLLKTFGWLGALWRYLWIQVLRQFQRPANKTLRIEAIAVSEAARGKGIGTLLMEKIFDRARTLGYQIVTLEVVNTNTAAHKLYERLGFRTIHTRWYGPITAHAGFTGAHYMHKQL